ncbi:NAD/NADP-dependent octopine/nopaline dehydrogenase family protein [Desulfoplanes formicivorans]|uniref:NADP transhydrogenase subunit alpha n=1 Tax=Desulfoplanes formicivorans TaxID=1592317 RepID=A0A194AEJ1_9BACT|nr:NAD/NADP-dependent octopine/nopaline dehydrogenase family protein [Desulfoplanes formicivorans]GAU07615.1 NADP transhydrogenase subunit alpha [Desulfoplanes formicivorans]
MKPIAVIGAGNSGLAMAAHLALEGHPVHLWNRTEKNISQLSRTKTIHCSGVISGKAKIKLVTDNLCRALEGVELILITTPANSHRQLAQQLSPFIQSDHKILLNPGRTFGALEFEYIFKKNLNKKNIPIAESQTIIYTCRKTNEDSVNILAFKQPVWIASKCRDQSEEIIQSLPFCLRQHFIPIDSLLKTSLGNVGPVLHCAPVLLNTGWIENKKTIFKYYYDGITITIANYIEKIDEIRVGIGRNIGVELEDVATWMQRSYQVKGDNLFQCIQNNNFYKTIDAPQNLHHRYLFEDIPCGLVPFEDLGIALGVNVSLITHLINFACSLMNFDFRKNGRTLDRIGISKRALNDLK